MGPRGRYHLHSGGVAGRADFYKKCAADGTPRERALSPAWSASGGTGPRRGALTPVPRA